jgi:hypothetical protein
MTQESVPKVMACFDQVGLKFDLTEFDSRLMAQKVVFLAQELGVNLGYPDYRFHLRGTYSKSLSSDLYAATATGQAKHRVPLTVADQERLRTLRDSIEIKPNQLEVAAAYRFLTAKQHLASDQAVVELKRTKPFISERDVAIGISRCKRLFPEITDADIDSLRDEMRPWDAETDRTAQ